MQLAILILCSEVTQASTASTAKARTNQTTTKSATHVTQATASQDTKQPLDDGLLLRVLFEISEIVPLVISLS